MSPLDRPTGRQGKGKVLQRGKYYYSLLSPRFNCGRWFARGGDDGSVERFLIAEKVPQTISKSCSVSALGR